MRGSASLVLVFLDASIAVLFGLSPLIAPEQNLVF